MERLAVLQKGRELTAKNSYYELEYNGKKHRVPLFSFQEDLPMPVAIWCNIVDGRPFQAYQNIYDAFYPDLSKEYIFRVKKRWDTLNYYELEDPKLQDDRIHHSMLYSQSNSFLKVGQYIKCIITDIKNDKLSLRLTNEHPSMIPYSSFDQVFGASQNPTLAAWLTELMKEDYMHAVENLYNKEDGRWILAFSTVLESAILDVIERDIDDKENLLTDFCRGWLEAVERSTFIRDMSEYEKQQYNNHLTHSIEICEDILDAVQTPNKAEVAQTCISSLNPQFYQYRIEKRLRFLIYTFSMRHDLMEENMPSFLAQLSKMGEKMCCEPRISGVILSILKMYVGYATRELEQALSINANDTLTIKQSVLALCYLLRILRNKESDEEPLYLSKLYQLLSLLNVSNDEKRKLLRNAYNALFSSSSSIATYNWTDFDNIVRNQILRFFTAHISVENKRTITFSNGNTCAQFSPSNICIAPSGTPDADNAHMKVMDDVDLALHYNKSLNRIATETEMLNIQNSWISVASSVFAQAQKQNRPDINQVFDGDEVLIYVVSLSTCGTKANCRVVDYNDKGSILFSDLLFYARPQLYYNDFIGSDGSPLVFRAICHKNNGVVTFDCNDLKLEMVQELLKIEETTCYIIAKKNKRQYQAITENGFFVVVNADEPLEIRSYVRVYITGRLSNGNGEGEYVRPSEYAFPNRGVYPNFLRLLNRFGNNGAEATVNSEKNNTHYAEEEKNENNESATASLTFMKTAIDVLSKYSRLEKETRIRYGYLSVCDMLCKLAGFDAEQQLMAIRLKYTTHLYQFSLNNSILYTDSQEFTERVAALRQTPELNERQRVIEVLMHFGKLKYQDGVDDMLFNFLRDSYSTPIVKELAKLVLASQMLSLVKNKALEDQLINELGEVLNINMIKQRLIHIGEESQTMEFKTSLVFPPANRGHIDVEQQSDNIARVVLSMMNTKGGTLYIGVNDDGNVIGLRNDLAHFSEKGKYDESQSKDRFGNFFSCLMKERLGAENASRLQFEFETIEGYNIFKIQIPEIHDPNIDYVRIGATSQRK